MLIILLAAIQMICMQNFKWAATWQNQWSDCAPVKTQISLGIRPVWSESSLSAWRKLGSLATHWAHREDSDQTGRMPGWSESLLGTQSLYWFCHVAAQITIAYVMWCTMSKEILLSLLTFKFLLINSIPTEGLQSSYWNLVLDSL